MTWQDILEEEKSKPYFQSTLDFVNKQRALNVTIYPESSDVFNAFKKTPLESVKVIILGQDPYHGPMQAHGLSFSVQKSIPFPPSLLNIFKELKNDMDKPIPKHGCLDHWAHQGVLLLNTVLTVEAHKAHSHRGIGWEIFTDHVIHSLSSVKEHLVFLLWGSHAIKKSDLIDNNKHTVLTAPHPSPLSAHRGFFGCKHFSTTNTILKEKGLTEITW